MFTVVETHESGIEYPVAERNTKTEASKLARQYKVQYPGCEYSVRYDQPAKIDYRTAQLLGA